MGDIRKQGINNTLITYLGILIGFFNNLVIMPSVLPKEELGLTRVLYSVAALFATIFPVGLAGAIVKFFPRFRDPGSGHHGFLRLLLNIAIACYCFFLIVALIFRSSILSWYDESPMLLEFFVWIIPMSFCIGIVHLLNGYCFSLFKSTFPIFLNEVFNRIWLMAVLLVYFMKIISFDVFVGLFTGSFFVQLLLLALFIAKVDNGLYHRIDRKFLVTLDKREIFHFLLLMAPATLASAALKLVDVSMVGSNLNKGNPLRDAAIYGIAVTIASIIEAPSNALIRIADYKVSDALNKNDISFIESVYRNSTRVLMVIGGLLFVGIAINIKAGLELIPGNFSAGYFAVLIVGCGTFVNMATGVNSSLVFYSPRYREGTLLLFTLIVFTVVLNYFLIPIYGIEGAALGTASSAIIYNTVKALIIWRHYKIQPYGYYALIVLGLMVICFLLNSLLPRLGNNYADILYRSFIIGVLYIV